MELLKGYMQTEVGVIPNDWDIKELGEICRLSKTRINPVNSTENYKCVELEHLSQGSGLLIGYVDSKNLKSQKSVFVKGDVLFGKLRPYLRKYLLAKFDGVCTTEIWVLKSEKNISNGYLFYLVQSEKIIEAANLSTGTKMPRAEWKTVSATKIPVPTKSEQIAIAKVLSDTDAFISSLEILIDKKRKIKLGAIQDLLKPKDRWENYFVKDLIWFQEGPGVRKHQFKTTGVKLLNGTNINKGKINLDKTDRFISESEAFGWYSHFLVDAGDILIACSGITVDRFHEKVSVAERKHLPLCMNTSTMRFKITSKKLNFHFFRHFLKSVHFKKQIAGEATGSAQLNFGPSHINNIIIWMPDFNEQQRISEILNDLDHEIELLEIKLLKAINIKTAIMQNLLTGKIRLI